VNEVEEVDAVESALTMRCLAGCGAVFGIIVARALTDLLGLRTVLGGIYVIGGVYLLLLDSPKHGGLSPSSLLFLLPDEKLKCVAVGVSAIPSDAIAARSNCQSDMSNLFLLLLFAVFATPALALTASRCKRLALSGLGGKSDDIPLPLAGLDPILAGDCRVLYPLLLLLSPCPCCCC